MKFRITNTEIDDSIVIEADNIEEIRKIAIKEQKKRSWKNEDCFSELLD